MENIHSCIDAYLLTTYIKCKETLQSANVARVTGYRGRKCDGGAPTISAEPVQQTLRPRHECQRQCDQDQV